MEKREPYAGLGAALGMLVLILDSRTALEGARTGIDLCIRTVIPSLFPFFILSILLTRSLMGTSLPWLRPLGRLCGLPEGAEALLITAFLGGYPVGAQAAAEGWRSGCIGKKDAQRMLAFCSNAGPAFLFGMVGTMLPDRKSAWLLWIIHVAGAVMTAMVLPGGSSASVRMPRGQQAGITDALNSSLRVMAGVCGWVVLFRILIAFLERWVLWLLPMTARVALTGLLELSNGCCDLWKIPDMSFRILAASGMLSLGGVCVLMQTRSVTRGLSLKYYCLGKLMQTAVCLILWDMVLNGHWLLGPVMAVFALMLRKIEKRGGIYAASGV